MKSLGKRYRHPPYYPLLLTAGLNQLLKDEGQIDEGPRKDRALVALPPWAVKHISYPTERADSVQVFSAYWAWH
jgi:hypothetical protein